MFRTNSGEFYQGRRVYSKEFKQDVLVDLYIVKGLPEGFTDLLFCGFNGKVAFIEVKQPKKKPKPEQVNFMALMKKYGYKTGVARSVEDALKIVKEEK